MTNYSNLDKILHRQFIGNSKLSNFLFNRIIEKSQYSKNHNLESHIFITGLARSGSTALLNKLFSSNEIASLTYKDMPFVLSATLSKYYGSFYKNNEINEKHLIERFHNDGIKINNNSPECLEEPFWLKAFPNKKDNPFQELINIPEKILHGYSYLLHKHAAIKGHKRLIVKTIIIIKDYLF